jgi:hypothetical protein
MGTSGQAVRNDASKHLRDLLRFHKAGPSGADGRVSVETPGSGPRALYHLVARFGGDTKVP